jgi:hypothetical protein
MGRCDIANNATRRCKTPTARPHGSGGQREMYGLAEGQHLTLILPENGTEWEPSVEDEDVRQWRAE